MGKTEKGVLRGQIRRVAKFCGVNVLTYSLMDNHFHLLIEVGEEREVPDEVLLERASALYTVERVEEIKNSLEGEQGDVVREQLKSRMGEVSVFMKELKQRFSIWYNRSNERFGTLWAERFKSVLVEGRRQSMAVVGAYIDLNSVRAGYVDNPSNYQFCGYAEAMVGRDGARNGICRMVGVDDPVQALADYRVVLFGKGAGGGRRNKVICLNPQDVEEIMQREGAIGLSEAVRCRWKFFVEGKAFGSKTFIELLKRELRPLLNLERLPQGMIVPFASDEEMAVWAKPRKSPGALKKPPSPHDDFD